MQEVCWYLEMFSCRRYRQAKPLRGPTHHIMLLWFDVCLTGRSSTLGPQHVLIYKSCTCSFPVVLSSSSLKIKPSENSNNFSLVTVKDPRAPRPYLFFDGQNIYNRVVLLCTVNVYITAS